MLPNLKLNSKGDPPTSVFQVLESQVYALLMLLLKQLGHTVWGITMSPRPVWFTQWAPWQENRASRWNSASWPSYKRPKTTICTCRMDWGSLNMRRVPYSFPFKKAPWLHVFKRESKTVTFIDFPRNLWPRKRLDFLKVSTRLLGWEWSIRNL